jgi:hypothetical protein
LGLKLNVPYLSGNDAAIAAAAATDDDDSCGDDIEWMRANNK